LNDEKIICQPQLELIKMKCPVSRRAFSSPQAFSTTLQTYRLSFVKRPGQFRLIKKTTRED
jgi:hypothetical protein